MGIRALWRHHHRWRLRQVRKVLQLALQLADDDPRVSREVVTDLGHALVLLDDAIQDL